MRAHIAWMMGGRLAGAASMWLVVIALAHFGSSEMLGEYSYALAIVAPLIMFSRLNLRVFMVTDTEEQFRPGDYLSTRVVANAVVMLLVLGLVLARGMSAGLAGVVLAVALFKLVESTSDFYQGLLQAQQRMRPFAVSLALHGVVCLIAFAVGIFVWGSVLAGALVTAAGWLLLLYGYDRPRARSADPRPLELSLARVPAVARACALLGVITGLITLRVNVPVYFIEARFGLADLGQYSAAAYFLLLGNLLVASVLEVAMPRIAKARAARNGAEAWRLLGRVVTLLLALGAAGIVAALLFGEWVMALVYGESYARTAPLLVLFAVAVTIGFVAQALGALLTVARRFGYQLAANVVSIAVIALVCVLALGEYGLIGAGMAVVAGAIALLCMNGWAVFRCRELIFRPAAIAAAGEAVP